MKDIPHSAELVVLHRHARLQLWDDYPHVVISWLQWFQLQFALYERREGEGERGLMEG